MGRRSFGLGHRNRNTSVALHGGEQQRRGEAYVAAAEHLLVEDGK